MNKRTVSNASTPPVDGCEVMFSLVQMGHAIEQKLEQALEQVGLSGAKFAALSHMVQAGGPLSLSECATRMTCVRSNVTQLMDRLEADGLVRRVEDPSDRRAVRAAVTPLGLERQAAGALQIEKVQQTLSAPLQGLDRDAITRALTAIK